MKEQHQTSDPRVMHLAFRFDFSIKDLRPCEENNFARAIVEVENSNDWKALKQLAEEMDW